MSAFIVYTLNCENLECTTETGKCESRVPAGGSWTEEKSARVGEATQSGFQEEKIVNIHSYYVS